jgi:hypothetical protein
MAEGGLQSITPLIRTGLSGRVHALVRSIFATMLAPVRRAACATAIVLAACSGLRDRTSSAAPPRAEFLLSSVDSTFWVATTSGTTRVRGAPLVLARYDGRFFEVYGTDDDRSYDDALLVGEGLYRRDLISGDSVLVFADSVVPGIADEYARAHPDERPLGPDDEGETNPHTSATAEIDILDLDGPYLSYEYRVDVTLPGRQPWHSTRRGVLDLRSGKETLVADLFGRAAGNRITETARTAYQAIRDSILRARPSMRADERRAADALAQRAFDDRAFTLSDDGRAPTITFNVPGRGPGAAGNDVELEPIDADTTDWWRSLVATLPVTDDAGNDRWTGTGYSVLARYDTSGEIARVSLADSANREWPVGTVLAPLRRIDWLDHPAIGDAERQALIRAFNQAATYDRATRVAALPSAASPFHSNLQLVASHAPRQDRSRKPARKLRADDARACQQHGPCVRRRHPLDDGQDRGNRRVSSQPFAGRDGVDRPSRLSRADSPRRPRSDAGERELRRANVDGSGRSCGSRRPAHGPPATHELVLSDLRCR